MSTRPIAAPRSNDGADFVRAAVSPGERRTAGMALKLALVDFYAQSWRLLVLNTTLSVLVLLVVLVGLAAPASLLLLLLVGPFAAALMHCAVVLAQTGELTLGEALTGLRLHWRRGLALGVLGGAAVVLTITAVRFYGSAGVATWPLAILERGRPLGQVARRAALELLRRPAAFGGLALALLLVNALATAAALVPFLTLTIAYSFLAAAHFALPRSPLREDPR